MNLADLTSGQEGVIVKVKGHGAFRKRIIEMGFIRGKNVEVIKNAPLKDPIEYQIIDYKVSLRRAEAAMVEVVARDEDRQIKAQSQPFNDTSSDEPLTSTTPEHRRRRRRVGTVFGSDELLTRTALKRSKTINVALVGNPNCGKTTIFNFASGANEHVGNYSGVTIDVKTGVFHHNGYTLKVSDLPGTYSLSAYSPEEVYVREHISRQTPDIIINVVDGSNIERNLYLTTQLIDMDVRTVVALNMFDELTRKGNRLNFGQLGKMLGIPFVPTVGAKGKGIQELFQKVIDVYEDRAPESRQVKINYGTVLGQSLNQLEESIAGFPELTSKLSPRFLAIKLLEKDTVFQEQLSDKQEYKSLSAQVDREIKNVEQSLGEDTETLITDARYGFIAGALRETFRENPRKRRRKTDAIDAFLTHRLFGFPIFFFFMWLMFQATFQLGQYPMNWIEKGVTALSRFTAGIMTPGPFTDLIVDGILGGVGGVIVFLPNILILFFCISFMEDTGYMARAAFIMDKVMHKIGLHGKSFIPLIMGFGCNVPAIMSTRTIEDRNSRLLTILINPLMSCSARLPVYILLIGAFFPQNPGSMLFLLYGTGIALAAIIAKIFKRFLFKKNNVPFVMELPPYRLPTLKSTTRHMWHKGQQYLQKMGGVILIASIIIWFLGYYPRSNEQTRAIELQKNELTTQLKQFEKQAAVAPIVLSTLTDSLTELTELEEKIRHEGSYIGSLGKAIEPAIRPLGFDWKMGVSLLSGIAAKEIVVSTMSVLYQAEEKSSGGNTHLIEKIQTDTYPDGTKIFTPRAALSFLIFTLIYFPCIAVVAAIKKEAGSWKWAAFTIFYTTALAWLLSFLVYQVGGLIF